LEKCKTENMSVVVKIGLETKLHILPAIHHELEKTNPVEYKQRFAERERLRAINTELHAKERQNVPPQGKISYLDKFCDPSPDSEVFDLCSNQQRLSLDDTLSRYMLKHIHF
jgi:hypothetical protein